MRPFNLFVYGTLMSPAVFRAVLGKRLVPRQEDADNSDGFHPRDGVLDDYTKVSPDNTYLYAVPDPHGRIRGYLIGPLPGQCMPALRRFEGRNYTRRPVTVHTKDGTEKAYAFVGNLTEMSHSFGYEFRDHLKQEILLEKKIDAAVRQAELEQLHTDESLLHRAVRELRGPTIRDIIRRHFDAGGISDYAIVHSIKDVPLPDFDRLVDVPEAQAVAPNYLALVVRQAIFNQIEDRIRQDFRYELDHLNLPAQLYERTVSSLVSLRYLNERRRALAQLVEQCLAELDFTGDHLIDFVRRGVAISDLVYEAQQVRRHIEYVRTHLGAGYVPMGAELEFSNIGHDVIRDPQAETVRDPQFDGFYYFYDFALNLLTWKLGGHVDDHRKKSLAEPRRGFFEVALGSLSIEANISKPVTSDPWLLNQFIHQARQFYDIKPHSVHISMQLRSRHKPVRDKLLPLSIMKCLFAIAGDPQVDADGSVKVKRLVTNEIITSDPTPGMMFTDISRRHSVATAETDVFGTDRARGRFIQQFKFLRLAPEINYEPIVMALKGVQLRLKPGSFLTSANYESNPRHREMFERLLAWGSRPDAISRPDRDEFLQTVCEGLSGERRGRPAHKEAYIAWALHELRKMLENFNSLLKARRREHRRSQRDPTVR